MRRRHLQPRSRKMQLVIDYAYLFLGATIVGVAFNLFLFPNKIASGGVSGISTILGHVMQIEPGYIQWLFNIPLFIAGLLLLGKQFGLKTLLGTIFLPLVVIMTAQLEPITHDPFLAALFGGVGVGLGLGIIFRGKSSTGGTDLAAQIVHKYTAISLGASILIIDGFVVLSSAIAFDLELALYALISLFVTGRVINVVQVGLAYAKVAFIITNEQEKMKHALLHDLDRGVTKVSAIGGYTEHERPMLMCVVQQMELSKLKELVRQHDPQAFVIVTDTTEVLGEGFKRA